eukprot:TRINITY_DN38845_c0_g1_i5.p1 TRINITY_DN38845_c0_g1~~TRINITY_DN38845_c0_g1_i5.p1  ORF type:complete len:141 (+),score=3.90 TRINITY_DN38845_c0_g1_i5:86-508(+)
MNGKLASADKRTIIFCFDTTSTYSWLGLEVILRYEKIWNVEVEICPVLLGGIMKLSGNIPPIFIKAKVQYSSEDIKRQAQICGVPYRGTPKNFGAKENIFKTVLAQRILVAACEKYAQRYTKLKIIQPTIGCFGQCLQMH